MSAASDECRWSQDGDGEGRDSCPSKEANMINPVHPGPVRIDDARHHDDGRRRRRRRHKDEEEEEPRIPEPVLDEKTKLNLVA